MYTFSKIEKKYPKVNRALVTIISLLISITALISSVKFILNFIPLYKFDINFLKIEELARMTKEDILSNYETLISYLKTSFNGELRFPTLPMSPHGKIHFVEVKNIFVTLDYIMYIALFLSVIGIIYCVIKKDYLFLKLNSIFLIILPVLLAIPFAIDFDKTFTAFHKLFFNNDYWLFDPKTDPIINLLPQDFFMHCAILILVIIAIESIISFLLYKLTKKNNYKNTQYR
jgi:integral membrane protein (TIGR01906 family)